MTLPSHLPALVAQWREQAKAQLVAVDRSQPTDVVYLERLRATEWTFRHCADELEAALTAAEGQQERWSPIEQWRAEAEINRQAWLKSQAIARELLAALTIADELLERNGIVRREIRDALAHAEAVR